MTEENRKVLRAVAILVGTTIGAGMFGIPYVVSKIGFIPGMFYLFLLGILVLLLNLSYGEVILRTPGDHQFGGYIDTYLGKKRVFLKAISIIAFFISAYGALLAYLIKIGDFFNLFFGGGSPFFYSVLFFLLGSFTIFLGLRMVSWFEFAIVIFLVGLIIFIAAPGMAKMEISHFSYTNLSFFLLPYGVILFALTGSSVIPEMEEILRKNPRKLKKSIIIGSLIPLFVYCLFTIFVFGVCGALTSTDAITGLVPFFSPFLVKLGAIIGILAMGSSFFTLGYILKEVWFRDFKASKNISFLLACLPSFFLFLFGARNFIKILDFSGAVSGGLIGILILMMFEKAKKTGKRKPAFVLAMPKFLIIILYLIFFLGIFSPFFNKI
jgi:tyrosine-specific transport protein